MSNFRIGQKVVCVKEPALEVPGDVNIRLNEIYTISGFAEGRNVRTGVWETGVQVEGVWLPPHWSAVNSDCFRPAVERKTDISIFQKILDDAPPALVAWDDGEWVRQGERV